MKTSLLGMLFGAACFCFVAVSRANDTAENNALADCRLTVLARQALRNEATLGMHNLGVTVQNRVATMWGVIDSAELSRRAEETLRAVPGIASVKNDLRVERPAQSGKPQLVQSLSPVRADSPPLGKPRVTDSLTRFTGWAPPGANAPPVVSLGAPVFREPVNHGSTNHALLIIVSSWWR